MLCIWFWIMYCCIPTPPLTVTVRVTLNMPSATNRQGISHCLESGHPDLCNLCHEASNLYSKCYVWKRRKIFPDRSGHGCSSPSPDPPLMSSAVVCLHLWSWSLPKIATYSQSFYGHFYSFPGLVDVPQEVSKSFSDCWRCILQAQRLFRPCCL